MGFRGPWALSHTPRAHLGLRESWLGTLVADQVNTVWEETLRTPFMARMIRGCSGTWAMSIVGGAWLDVDQQLALAPWLVPHRSAPEEVLEVDPGLALAP